VKPTLHVQGKQVCKVGQGRAPLQRIWQPATYFSDRAFSESGRRALLLRFWRLVSPAPAARGSWSAGVRPCRRRGRAGGCIRCNKRRLRKMYMYQMRELSCTAALKAAFAIAAANHQLSMSCHGSTRALC
jgi:hypothetical protein